MLECSDNLKKNILLFQNNPQYENNIHPLKPPNPKNIKTPMILRLMILTQKIKIRNAINTCIYKIADIHLLFSFHTPFYFLQISVKNGGVLRFIYGSYPPTENTIGAVRSKVGKFFPNCCTKTGFPFLLSTHTRK